jgi:UDPglucose 6-dehydrogenase
MNKKPMTISVVGLGKLGAPMVACAASKGFNVIGVDVNPDHVQLINQAQAPVVEPQLSELLQAHRSQISATQNYQEAVLNSEITFVVVATPSDAQGGFSTEYVKAAARSIGETLRQKESWHLVVLTSTVLPGATERDVLSALEKYSGKKCGVDFGLCYNPEFIALGSVIRNMLNPDFILIGQFDPKSGDTLERFYRQLVNNNAPIARMNIVNAELTKISINTFVTTKISYANMLAEICEQIPGCDADVVTSALGMDTRIGPKYIKGALGYGGPCFPRDNIAFAYMARSIGVEPTLAEATDTINRRQVSRLANIILSHLPAGGKVGILGLSYKPDTNIVEESQGLELACMLLKKEIQVVLYDPLALDNARKVLGDKPIFAPSLQACTQQADVLVVTTPWPEFKNIQLADLVRNPKRPVVLDCWRILDGAQINQVADYVTLGTGEN